MNVNRSGKDNNGRNTPAVSREAKKEELNGRPKKPVRYKP